MFSNGKPRTFVRGNEWRKVVRIRFVLKWCAWHLWRSILGWLDVPFPASNIGIIFPIKFPSLRIEEKFPSSAYGQLGEILGIF